MCQGYLICISISLCLLSPGFAIEVISAMLSLALYETMLRHCQSSFVVINTLRPTQNGRPFADDVFKSIFLNENVWILLMISLKFVAKGPINNIPSLVQIMTWRRPGDKPLSETTMVRLQTYICVTRPQWFNDWYVTKTAIYILLLIVPMFRYSECIYKQYKCITNDLPSFFGKLKLSYVKKCRNYANTFIAVKSKCITRCNRPRDM